MSKDKLNKGIQSLLSNIEKKSVKEKKDVVKQLSNTIAFVKTENIEFNPFQPRKEFNDKELQELSDSIKTLGLIQPVTVRSVGKDKYQLISGERRLRACRLAELKEIPAFIRIADDQAMMEMALVENIQRSDLNPLEIAFAYQRLIDECDLTHQSVAQRVGKNRTTVTNYLRILKLPPTIQNGIKEEKISMGHARALVGIEEAMTQLKMYNDTVNNNLSVRALEKRISNLNNNDSPEKTIVPKDPKIRGVEKRLTSYLDTRINIKQDSKGKGQISIDFDSVDKLNDILEKIGIM